MSVTCNVSADQAEAMTSPALYAPGDVVLSFHGPLLYEAKVSVVAQSSIEGASQVLKHEIRSFDQDQHWYDIHYTGWATRCKLSLPTAAQKLRVVAGGTSGLRSHCCSRIHLPTARSRSRSSSSMRSPLSVPGAGSHHYTVGVTRGETVI